MMKNQSPIHAPTRMRLLRVVYEVFESDADRLDTHTPLDWHEIDREIRLDGSNGEHVYVTWGCEPVQYSVQLSSKPCFLPPVPVSRDMSESLIWSRLIGREVILMFLDEAHQVLEICSGNGAVYCSSQGRGFWMLDVLNVSMKPPAPPLCDTRNEL